jgi:hypothetical protein
MRLFKGGRIGGVARAEALRMHLAVAIEALPGWIEVGDTASSKYNLSGLNVGEYIG